MENHSYSPGVAVVKENEVEDSRALLVMESHETTNLASPLPTLKEKVVCITPTPTVVSDSPKSTGTSPKMSEKKRSQGGKRTDVVAGFQKQHRRARSFSDPDPMAAAIAANRLAAQAQAKPLFSGEAPAAYQDYSWHGGTPSKHSYTPRGSKNTVSPARPVGVGVV